MKEYLLVYKKKDLVIKPIKVPKRNDWERFKQYLGYYTKIIENPDAPVDQWVLTNIRDYARNRDIDISGDRLNDFKIKNADRIIYRTSNETLERVNFPTVTAEYTSSDGVKYIWWEGKEMLFLSENMDEYVCDFWPDISTININKEGGVTLNNGKKPERLLQRIISMFTDEDDIVLDAYFGTGTTGAVAMKLKRRFIGIEQLDSHYEKAVARLTNVLNGEQNGISKDVGWSGGGSFLSVELANNSNNLIDQIQKANSKELEDSAQCEDYQLDDQYRIIGLPFYTHQDDSVFKQRFESLYQQ